MKLNSLVFGSCFLFMIGCAEDKKQLKNEEKAQLTDKVIVGNTVELPFPVYDYEGLEPLLNKNDGKTYIVNFWATWCKPCLEEMPYFQQIYEEQRDNNVELILVSLDMPSMWKKRLIPYVEKKGLKGKLVILDDPKMNEWIPKINKDWGGGIPATLIYNEKERVFYEKGFSYDGLYTELQKFLN
ncbi:TlpA family protein disulfide reductase [Muricauda sp. SCSIO 64092]|uniref:TlpA family protein disulfide reductase n=1 Tax=Allomuricauda sp. SCSIO 64092 TaxID=2908842 RepID=UPI001FF1BCC3|nr:TlpA family protein disulfide reductase [Muricauda sp. SCSIO 64092]UOY07420.1 TlpA family protein disulfide reductase [Muricauda sp. SCSIO 64092]